jgi:HAD superfamily hydrolase (TIGR01509 family)
MPHIRAVLDETDLPYCLASSSDPERIRMTLSVARLAHYFDGRIYSGSMVEHSKPAPDLFLLAAAKMGAAPARTLVVEDSINGVLAGKAAGMTVWGFIGGSHYAGRDGRKSLSEAGADRVFDSMADFWAS